MIRFSLVAALAGFAAASPGVAQEAPASAPVEAGQAAPGQAGPAPLEVSVTGGISAPMPIAVPVMPTQQVTSTPAGSTDALGRQLSEIVTNDLRNSGLFSPLSAGQLRPVAFPEVTAPGFDYWGGTGAQALVQGFVRANGDGTLTVGCYL